MRLLGIVLITMLGCTTPVVHDPSIDAFNAGDYTLVSTCSAVPGKGMDTCLVTDGTPIESSWRLLVPTGKDVLGGEVDVYSRSLHKQYPITGTVVEISWKEFFGATTWSTAMDSEVEALVLVRWKDPTGVVQTTKFRGLAKIIVTKIGYDRMPIDSGFANWGDTCEVQYSTAGRSALRCQTSQSGN